MTSTRISSGEALDRVLAAVGSLSSDPRRNFGQVDVTVAPEKLPEVCLKLRDEPGLQFKFFTFLSAIDRSEFGSDEATAGGLEVLVHLYSPEHVAHVNIHVPVDADDPKCPTITGIYLGAVWHERETHEMFGIDFEGHPRLVNLYLPEDFEGHPLRRSFKLPSRSVKDWPGAKDPEEAAAGGR